MKRIDPDRLELGPDVVRRILPHRPPLLLVDRIHTWRPTPVPVLTASRYLSGSEAVFAGHFAELSLWPGVYTIEGLGQACNLLYILRGIELALAAAGRPPALLAEALRNAERGFTLAPGFDPGLGALGDLLPDHRTRMGMAAHVDVKLLAPVFAGCRLDYRVELVAEHTPFVKCAVEASVAGTVVARGTLTSTSAVPALPDAP